MTAHPLRNLTFSEMVMPRIFFTFLSKLSPKRMLTMLLALCVLLVLSPATSVLADEGKPPLPDDLKIEAPGPEVPGEISNFLGIWEGQWKAQGHRSGPPLLLAVEKVYPRKATVVFSLGRTTGRFPRGWNRQESTFSEVSGRLELPVVLTSSPPVQKLDIHFFLNDRGNLEGRLFGMLAYGGYSADIELHRKRDVAVPGALSSPAGGEVAAGKQRSRKIIQSESSLGKVWKMPKGTLTSLSSGPIGGMLDVRDMPAERRSTEDVLYNEGLSYLKEGEYEKAASKFKEVIRFNPRNYPAILNCGLAYALQGRYDQALDEFSKYLTLDPKNADAYYNRALVYALKGQFDQALADINKTIGTNPNDAQAYYLRGFIHLKKNELNPSRSDYQKASELNPDFVRQIKKEKTELGQYPLILEGKKEPPRQDKEHKHKGKTLAQQGEYAQALSELDQALALDPKDAENFTRRGGIYTLQKQYDKAMDDFNRALELDPRSAKAYYNRALAYYYQGKYDLALSDLQKTIELKPKDAEAYHNRGLIYNQKNDDAKAIDDFNMAIALNPKLADAYFSKAATCERAGRQDEAKEAYAAYLKVAPPGARDQIEQARSRVGQPRQLE